MSRFICRYCGVELKDGNLLFQHMAACLPRNAEVIRDFQRKIDEYLKETKPQGDSTNG